MGRLFITLTALTLIFAGCGPCADSSGGAEPGARAATANQGRSGGKITALGTVEPEEVVDVGARVAGSIVSLGADPHAGGKPIDFGSPVEAGTVLAQIDRDLYAVRVEEERAGLMRAEAELAQAKINLEHAATQWQIAQTQKKNQAISDADLELANFHYKIAKPSVDAAEAALVQHRAALKRAEIELDYTAIRSPVRGVVIARRVNVGQMVRSDTATPSLFLVANLEKLEVWASVHEADIARIRQGQHVRFTVDAYPGKVFEGKVKQMHLDAQSIQNVVVYTVAVAISSPAGKLLPYMTAHLEFD